LSECGGLAGVADLTPARDFISSQGYIQEGDLPRAVSLGMQLNDTIVEQHNHLDPWPRSQYIHHIYEVVTRALDFLAYDVSRWLTDRGFKAFPIPGSTPYDFKKLEGILSHKLAAHLAGVGWIGKSCLLVTERFGPRVRVVTVMTDAALQTGTLLDRPCGKCHVCVDACPVEAIRGVEYRAGEGREARFDAVKCRDYRREHACGLCVSSCPLGTRELRRKKKEGPRAKCLGHGYLPRILPGPKRITPSPRSRNDRQKQVRLTKMDAMGYRSHKR
jgi:epoxyqueuosine reductase